jgi:hypothetical protein
MIFCVSIHQPSPPKLMKQRRKFFRNLGSLICGVDRDMVKQSTFCI